MLTSLSDMMDNYKNLLQPNWLFSQRSSSNNNETINIAVSYENLLNSPFMIVETEIAVKVTWNK